MGGYRGMGNVEIHSENGASKNLIHQLRDLWGRPGGTVLRIEALALVAITLSFFLAAFGSCRRWSNHWIVQKGFLAAQVLSLSLGTYSIGLMQSSSVQSEMYPIWAVSLLTLFGCVDPVTTYNGLDYMGPFSKMVFQLCLYCGYVLLMSASTISGGVGNLAIAMLSAIAFIRGFHRSLAFVLPTVMRDGLGRPVSPEPGALAGYDKELEVPPPDHHYTYSDGTSKITMDAIRLSCNHMGEELGLSSVTGSDMTIIEDVCLGYSLSRLLQRRFLGLDTPREMEEKRERFERLFRDGAAIDYKRTLNAVEVELAFLYEVFFTSNEFLHHYEAKSSNFWVLASFIGVCFVGVATTIPGIMTSRFPNNASANCTASTTTGASAVVVVATTAAHLTITLVMLASLALLQLVQLMRCWTSNWARVSFAYEYAASKNREKKKQIRWGRTMRLKVFVVTRINWFDKYLWQDKLGQYSIVVDGSSRPWWLQPLVLVFCCPCHLPWRRCRYEGLPRMLGMEYVGHLLGGLSFTSDGGTAEAAVRLREQDDAVKVRIAEFLGQIKSRRIGVDWSSLFADNGLGDCLEYLPCYSSSTTPDAYAFTHRVLAWHVATCYCELAEQEEAGSAGRGEDKHRDDSGGEKEKNRRVAIALSKYCAYLLVSAPELLPGPSAETKRALERDCPMRRLERNKLMKQESDDGQVPTGSEDGVFKVGVYWGKRLLNLKATPPPALGTETGSKTPRRRRCSDHWEVLALLWVQTLLYAAPYGDVQRHMQHLSQGGEFITHLWALLYHIGIDKWEMEETREAEMEEIADY